MLGLAGFALVALDDAMQGPVPPTDAMVRDDVSGWQAAGFPAHQIGFVLTQIGASWTVTIGVAAGAAWMFWKRQPVLAIWCIGIAVASTLAVIGLKDLFQRVRPLDYGALGYSFPSGHTFGATASLGATIILVTEVHRRTHGKGPHRLGTRAMWALALATWGVLAFLTGIGRILVQEHWLSDVVASWSLGLTLVAGILLALSRGAPGGDTGPKVPEKKAD